MLKLAALIAWSYRLLWNVGTLTTGEHMAWVGSVPLCECGPFASVYWGGPDGVNWTVLWINEQVETDEYEAWGWVAEGRLGGPITLVS